MKLFKKSLLPPLIPTFLLVGLALYVLIAELMGGPRITDGHVDNAPYRASYILIIISPVFYGIFFLLDRARRPVRWIATSILTILLAAVLFCMFYEPRIDSLPLSAILNGILGSFVVLLPMSLVRRRWVTSNPSPE